MYLGLFFQCIFLSNNKKVGKELKKTTLLNSKKLNINIYESINLCVCMHACACACVCVNLSKEGRPKESDTQLMVRLCGPEIKEHIRSLYNEEFHTYILYLLLLRLITEKRVIWARYTACTGLTRNAYKMLVGELQEKKPPKFG